MQDLILYPILEIIFLTQDSDLSQDLIPDLDLEISTNQLNVIYCHHMGHTANNCFRHQNRNFPSEDNQIKVGEIILEIPNDT